MPKPPREPRPPKDRPRRRAEPQAADVEATKSAAEAFHRRRNRRFLFLGAVALTFPILEAIAYQYRVIEIQVINNFRVPVTGLKVAYSGGEFEEAEIKPGESIVRRIRPDFSFKSSEFSTYRLKIHYKTGDGGIYNQFSKAGTIDYSAREIFTVVPSPPAGQATLQHTTRPGFPLGTIREFFQRLGLG